MPQNIRSGALAPLLLLVAMGVTVRAHAQRLGGRPRQEPGGWRHHVLRARYLGHHGRLHRRRRQESRPDHRQGPVLSLRQLGAAPCGRCGAPGSNCSPRLNLVLTKYTQASAASRPARQPNYRVERLSRRLAVLERLLQFLTRQFLLLVAGTAGPTLYNVRAVPEKDPWVAAALGAASVRSSKRQALRTRARLPASLARCHARRSACTRSSGTAVVSQYRGRSIGPT